MGMSARRLARAGGPAVTSFRLCGKVQAPQQGAFPCLTRLVSGVGSSRAACSSWKKLASDQADPGGHGAGTGTRLQASRPCLDVPTPKDCARGTCLPLCHSRVNPSDDWAVSIRCVVRKRQVFPAIPAGQVHQVPLTCPAAQGIAFVDVQTLLAGASSSLDWTLSWRIVPSNLLIFSSATRTVGGRQLTRPSRARPLGPSSASAFAGYVVFRAIVRSVRTVPGVPHCCPVTVPAASPHGMRCGCPRFGRRERAGRGGGVAVSRRVSFPLHGGCEPGCKFCPAPD
jgi:hypothetical protein